MQKRERRRKREGNIDRLKKEERKEGRKKEIEKR